MTDIAASQGLGPGGKKNDAGKIRYDLLPRAVLRGVAAVLTYGAKTYDENSWQKVPNGFSRYRAGQERHFDAVTLDGETLDHESGLHHAWHYASNALFVAWFMVFRPDEVEAFRAAQANGALPARDQSDGVICFDCRQDATLCPCAPTPPESFDVTEAERRLGLGRTVEVIVGSTFLLGNHVRCSCGAFEFHSGSGEWQKSSFPISYENCRFVEVV